ncbi:MAG: glycosyltransferase [Lachnospiraceae bacterium]|nr:glycosyltransferase [Lachnospiraceae bacterium]
MSNVKVSVIIPVYNTEQYLAESIESALDQTLKEIEIIVVDDGSSDDSGRIADAYAALYGNISVIHQENQNLGGARNTGLYAAKGRYIQYLDSDDVLRPEALEHLFNFAEKKAADVVTCDAVSFCEETFDTSVMNNYTRNKIGIDSEKVWNGKEFWNTFYKQGGVFNNAYLLFCRKDFLDEHKISFEKGVYYEDNEHGLKIHLLAQRLVYLPEQLYVRRYRTGSIITSPCSMTHLLSQITSVKKIWTNLFTFCTQQDNTECVSIYLASNIRKIRNVWERTEMIDYPQLVGKLEDLFSFIEQNKDAVERVTKGLVFHNILELTDYVLSKEAELGINMHLLQNISRQRHLFHYLEKHVEMQQYREIWVSVVVPIYNAESYLEECLDSILEQTFPNLEILLIDDGSTDGSADVCKRFRKIDKRVKYFYKFNGGSTSARKLGVQNATGKYVMFIDADDYIKPDMISYMVDIAENNEADIVTDTFITDVNQQDYPQGGKLEEGVFRGEDLKKKVLPNMFYRNILEHWGIWPTLWGKLFKRDIIGEKILELDERIFYGEDAASVFPACLKANCIYIIKKYFYHYRAVQNSVSKSVNKDLLDNMYYLHEYLYRIFSDSEYSEVLLKQLGYYMLNVMNHAGQKLFHIPYSLEEAQHLKQSIIQRDKQIQALKEINTGLASEVKVQRENIVKLENEIKTLKGKNIPSIWVLPVEKLKDNPKIILYGAGKVGQLFYRQIIQSEELELIAWADKSAIVGKGQIFPEKIKELDYDMIIIGVANESMAEQIEKELMELGITKDKIFWEKPRKINL